MKPKNQKINIQTATLLTAAILWLMSPINAQNLGISATGVAPDPSAGLDVNFTDRGVLIPRIALTSTTSAGPISNPANSLLVYNTTNNPSAGLTPGYYYNAGTTTSPIWVRLLNGGSPSDAWLTVGNAGTNSGLNFIGTTDNRSLRFRTNNVHRMVIDSIGNAGIGTKSPTSRLHVAGGDARIGEINPLNTGTFPGYGRYLYFSGGPAGSSYDSDNSDVLWIARYNVASDQTELRVNIGDNCVANDAFVVGTIGSACSPSGPRWDILRVQANGNVGIGTTAPAQKLDVYNNSDQAFIRVRANLANNGTQGYVGLMMSGSDQGWTIYQGDPDGGFGVGPRNFEIWEYPANPGGAGQCCRRRFVIENTFGLSTGSGPTNLILQNNGNVCSYGSFVSCSDVRLKKDFAKLDNILNKILMINTYYFHWNTSQFPEKFNDTTRQIGIKAQEIKDLFPELVSQDNEGFYQVAYDKLSVLAIQSIKEQQQIIQEQQKIIQKQQEEINALNEKLDILINTLSAEKKVGNK